MLKIKLGKKERRVTAGAFKSIYEPAGWKQVDDDTKTSGVGDELSDDDDTKTSGVGDELSDAELLEVPIGDMKTADLKRAAAIIGYDYKKEGLTVKQLREKMAEKLGSR